MSSDTRVSVIIGAASGMGAAVASRLADRGPVLLADRNGGTGIEACDITRTDDVDRLVGMVPALQSLVVTAGLSPSMARGRDIYTVNLIAMNRVLTAFEPTLRTGSVAVCFASTAGHMLPVEPQVATILDRPTDPDFFDRLAAAGVDVDEPSMAYVLSKAGVMRLVRRRAKSWGERGARIISLSPGIIDTEMGRLENANQLAMASMVEMSALGREGSADEVAAVVAFLVSADASFMTGSDVLVDGGFVSSLT